MAKPPFDHIKNEDTTTGKNPSKSRNVKVLKGKQKSVSPGPSSSKQEKVTTPTPFPNLIGKIQDSEVQQKPIMLLQPESKVPEPQSRKLTRPKVLPPDAQSRATTTKRVSAAKMTIKPIPATPAVDKPKMLTRTKVQNKIAKVKKTVATKPRVFRVPKEFRPVKVLMKPSKLVTKAISELSIDSVIDIGESDANHVKRKSKESRSPPKSPEQEPRPYKPIRLSENRSHQMSETIIEVKPGEKFLLSVPENIITEPETLDDYEAWLKSEEFTIPEVVPAAAASLKRKVSVKLKRTPKAAAKIDQLDTSESDLFAKYADVYNEVLQEDFGSIVQQPQPQQHSVVNADCEKEFQFLHSNHPVELEPEMFVFPIHSNHDPEPLNFVQGPIPQDPNEPPILAKPKLVRRVKTFLPTWISRKEWEDKKLLRQQYQTNPGPKSKGCTQLFPGRCFNQSKFKEQKRQGIADNMKHDKQLFQLTEAERNREEDMEKMQIKFKRMWETLEFTKPDTTHREIPYRQGSTIILGFPGHGSIVDNEPQLSLNFGKLTKSELQLQKIKMDYYKRMASLYLMEESEKKEKERIRMMTATKCILNICPSLLGNPSKVTSPPEPRPFGAADDFEQPDPTVPNPLLISDKRSLTQHLGYKTSTYNNPSPFKKMGSSKGNKPTDFQAFDEILTEPDHNATFFKICPTCQKYVRTSDLQTHKNQCCTTQNETRTPTQFEYFDGKITKSYSVKMKNPSKGARISTFNRNSLLSSGKLPRTL